MSSESLSGESSSSGSSSSGSSSESWTCSPSHVDIMSTESANRLGTSFVLVDLITGDQDPSLGHTAKGTNADVEIVEEGD